MSGTVAALRELVRTFPSALLGYSGGVDSAFLAVVLRRELGPDRMVAAIGRSASYPRAQWEAARAVAERFDVPLVEIDTHELDDPHYRANPTNRCFFCKTELWRRLLPEARARGLAVACDGTNAEDLRGGEHRPGYAAGQRAGIRSPLAEVGMTKPEIRAASRELGLPTWDAPAAPCLSSRVVFGLDKDGIKDIAVSIPVSFAGDQAKTNSYIWRMFRCFETGDFTHVATRTTWR